MIARRGFLAGMLAACAAPAIVRSGILMPVRPAIILPPALPIISGVGVAGQMTSEAGVWANATIFTYQWMRNGLPIEGATGPTYDIKPEDANALLRSIVTCHNPQGSEQRVLSPTQWTDGETNTLAVSNTKMARHLDRNRELLRGRRWEELRR